MTTGLIHHERDSGKLYPSRLSGDSIRVLEILSPTNRAGEGGTTPSISGGVLAVKLEEIKLSTSSSSPSLSKKFVALSHFWGSEENPATIEVNGFQFHLPQNIHRLLTSLGPDVELTQWSEGEPRRYSMRGRKFWVDAICINQKDKVELAAQVSIMRKIYASASATYVSVGETLPEDPTGDQLISWLHHMTVVPWGKFREMTREQRAPYWDLQQWNLMAQILEKPWFFRRWVIQEVVVSRNAFVLYGTSLLPWDRFSDASLHCSLLWDDHDINTPYLRHGQLRAANVQVVLSISHLQHEEREGHEKPSLLELLARFQRNGSMRSVDRIFAMLGICDPGQARTFTIDYDIPVEKVLTNFAISHVEEFNNLDFLTACLDEGRIDRENAPFELNTGAPCLRADGSFGGMTILPDFDWPKAEMEVINTLPSWTPNWTSGFTDWKIGPRVSSRGEIYKPIFHAAADFHPEVADLHGSRATGVLEVAGLDVDAVIMLNPFWPPSDPTQKDPLSNFYPWTWIDSKRMPRERTVYADDQSRWDAFCRLLVVGGWNEDAKAFMSSHFLRHAFRQFFDGTDFARDIDAMGFDTSIPEKEEDFFNDPLLPLKYRGIPSIAYGMGFLTRFRFAVTAKGRLALVPPQTRPNDHVTVIFGCSSPIILSPVANQTGNWIVRGEAYVDGLMLGEAAQAHRRGQIPKKMFRLV